MEGSGLSADRCLPVGLREDGGDTPTGLRLRRFSPHFEALAIVLGAADPASVEGTPRPTTPLLRAASPANPNGKGGDLSTAAAAPSGSRCATGGARALREMTSAASAAALP